MTKLKKPKNPKLSTNWTPIVFGIILAAVGVGFIALKNYVTCIGYVVGGFVCIGAVVLFTLAFAGPRQGAAFIFKIIFSVCSLATGIVTIICNEKATMIVFLVFAGSIAVDGAIKFGEAIQAKQYSISGRTTILIFALITAIAALLFFRSVEEEKIVAFSVWLGALFIVDAISNIINPFLKKRINSVIANDMIDRTKIMIEQEKEYAEAKAEEDKIRAEKKAAKEARKNAKKGTTAKTVPETAAPEEPVIEEIPTEETIEEAEEVTEEPVVSENALMDEEEEKKKTDAESADDSAN